ncbi:MAG: DNA-3-methyladenine glycosylase [Acidimicrobiia bacterium]
MGSSVVGVAPARDFYARPAPEVAVDLLGKLLVHGARAGRIVEVEAYLGAADPASHSFRGPTPRNATMFGPPGHLYVYRSYGIHWCANATCGDGGAVLLRALAPVAGIELQRASRPGARTDRDLCNGPGKLGQALALDAGLDGADLVTGDRDVLVLDDGTPPPAVPTVTARIGISVAVHERLRFYVPGDPNVSRPLVPGVRA